MLDVSPTFFIGLLKALIPALFMNIYILGLNQISDIAIDKVNKSYIMLASSEFSIGSVVAIVTTFAFMDILDVDGDRIFGIQSLTVRLGQKQAFWLSIYLLLVAYIVVMIMGVVSSFMWNKLAMVSSHVVLAIVLWRKFVQSYCASYCSLAQSCPSMLCSLLFFGTKLSGHVVLATVLWRKVQAIDFKNNVALTHVTQCSISSLPNLHSLYFEISSLPNLHSRYFSDFIFHVVFPPF